MRHPCCALPTLGLQSQGAIGPCATIALPLAHVEDVKDAAVSEQAGAEAEAPSGPPQRLRHREPRRPDPGADRLWPRRSGPDRRAVSGCETALNSRTTPSGSVQGTAGPLPDPKRKQPRCYFPASPPFPPSSAGAADDLLGFLWPSLSALAVAFCAAEPPWPFLSLTIPLQWALKRRSDCAVVLADACPLPPLGLRVKQWRGLASPRRLPRQAALCPRWYPVRASW